VEPADVDDNRADDALADCVSTLGGLFVRRNLGSWAKLYGAGAEAMTDR
jgi:hypothetical protein